MVLCTYVNRIISILQWCLPICQWYNVDITASQGHYVRMSILQLHDVKILMKLCQNDNGFRSTWQKWRLNKSDMSWRDVSIVGEHYVFTHFSEKVFGRQAPDFNIYSSLPLTQLSVTDKWILSWYHRSELLLNFRKWCGFMVLWSCQNFCWCSASSDCSVYFSFSERKHYCTTKIYWSC